MPQNLTRLIKNLRERKTIFFFLLTIFILLGAWAFLFYLPLPRQVGLSFRYDVTSIAVIIFLGSFLSLLIKGMWGELIFTAFFLTLSALPLSGLWASGQTEPYTLFGLLPFSDARMYYEGALRFLMGGRLTGISTFRPIAPAFLSLLLRLTDANLQAAIALQTLLGACAAAAAILYVRDVWGSWAASLFSLLVFFFWRPFIGTVLTENLGLALGLCGFLTLIAWSRTKKPQLLFLGALLLGLGLNIRAGAYFVLVSIFLVVVFFCKQLSKRSLLLFVAGVLLAWLANCMVSAIYSSKVVGFSSNVMNNLYQLVTNSDSWRELGQVYLDVDTSRTWDTLKLIAAEFFDNPLNLLEGLGRSYREFFSFGRPGAFGFIEGERVHTTRPSVLAATALLYLLSALGVARESLRWYRKKDLTSALLIMSLLGILLSAPILFSGGFSGMRFFAATMGFQIIFPCLGLLFLQENVFRWIKMPVADRTSFDQPPRLLIPSFLLILIMLGLPLNALFRSPPQMNELVCDTGETPVSMAVHHGSYVSIVTDTSPEPEYLPTIRESRARLSSHGLAPSFSSEFTQLSAPYSLVSGIDAHSNRGIILVLAPQEVPISNARVEICTRESGLPRLDKNGYLFSNEAFITAVPHDQLSPQ